MARKHPRGALQEGSAGAAGIGGAKLSGDAAPGPSINELDSMPGHLIRRVHQISTAIFAEECAKIGLTSVQFAALTAIRESPDVDATRLSCLIAFDRSTLGNVLERLEAKGWVLRTPSRQDKRIKVLRLSAEGAAVLDTVQPAVRRVQQRLLEPLAPGKRAEMMRMLEQLIRRHEHVSTGSPDVAEK